MNIKKSQKVHRMAFGKAPFNQPYNIYKRINDVGKRLCAN